MQKKEYFCPTCKKFVKEVRTEVGVRVLQNFLSAPLGEMPVFVCRKCDTPVMELTKSDKKTRMDV